MDEALYRIVAIIIGAGLLGGWGAFLADRKLDIGATESQATPPLRSFLVLGVVAAACIPLFLSLLKSDVIRTVFPGSARQSAPEVYEAYLIFLGLCLIAAFSSRAFLASITKQFLERLDRVDRTAREAAATAADAREVAHEAVEEVEGADEQAAKNAAARAAHGSEAPLATEAEAAPEDSGMSEPLRLAEDELTRPAKPPPLTAEERHALHAMTKRSHRTLSGIAEDAGISRNRISELLDSLADKGLAQPATSPRTGGARWVITRRGIDALNAAS